MRVSADFTGYRVEGKFLNVSGALNTIHTLRMALVDRICALLGAAGVSPSEIKVILNGGQYSTFVRVDGGFALYLRTPC